MEVVYADIRARLKDLPAAIGLGQPISHRLDHMQSGVRSQIAIEIFVEELETLHGQAYGRPPGKLLAELRMLVDGERVTQVVDGNRRFDLVRPLPDVWKSRTTMQRR